jgi:hypothetical protein
MDDYRPDLSNARIVDLSQVRLVSTQPWDLARQHIDGEFCRTQADLFAEHTRQEQRHLAAFKASFAHNHSRDLEAADRRYQHHMRLVDERYERMAVRLHRDQTSIRGRLAALTEAGRSHQEWQRAVLRVRAGNLRVKVMNQLNGRKDQLFERREAARKEIARELKDMRRQHQWQRFQRSMAHELRRDDRIEAHAQRIREQRAEQARRQERERTQTQDRQQSRSS